MSRILVFAAHPDDEVLGMGGTIAVHAKLRGDAVRIVCVTDGSSSQYPGDSAIRERKNDEARRAAEVLGVSDYVHLDFPDMRLDTVAHMDVNGVAHSQIRAFAPDVVYCVHPDVNLDHRAVFDSVMVATRPVPGQTVRRVLTFAPPSSSEWTPPPISTFLPTWFVDVSDTLELKLEAFECYRTEQREWPHPRNARALRATAEHYGSWIGADAAEPFVLIRAVGEPA
jgi:N-acetylglucosamine malate deacetylase 1